MSEVSGLQASIQLQRSNGFKLDVELNIAAGTTACLLGPNGAGKSTAVGALAGLINIEGGSIRLNGRTLNDPSVGIAIPPPDRKIGLMFQDYALFGHLSVEDNIAFGPRSAGLSKSASRLAAAEWTHKFDLIDLAGRKASDLSGGQAQRVAMARTLAANPDLILLDEPLAALDVGTKATLRRILSTNLEAFDGPRLIITHEPAEAFLLADRIHIMENGRITQSGTAAEIRRSPATAYVGALAGTNFLTGSTFRGSITLDESNVVLKTSDTTTDGRVIVTVRPSALALHPSQPDGSPRNSWQAKIASVENLGDVARVYLDAPLPLAADVTPGSVEQLGLSAGQSIWVAIKATEISVSPA